MLIRFILDRRGNFSLMTAFMLAALAGTAGLVGEYGNGLFHRIQDQRLADAAAIAGATVYDETNSNSSMNTAVSNVAALNGLNGTIAASLVTSPTGDGKQAVLVTVTTHAPLLLSRLLLPAATSSVTINATSYAEMKPGSPGCIIALNTGGTGVTVNGGASVSAPGCAIASNQTVNCHSSTNTITTKYVYVDSGAVNPIPTCGYVQAPTGFTLTESNAYTSDPLVGTSEVLGQTSRLTAVNALTSPTLSFPGVGASLAFSGSSNAGIITALAAQGCVGLYASSVWTITCAAGTHTFGTVSVSGATVNFAVGGSSSNVYNFTQVATGAGTLNFGPGTFNIAQGVLTTNGSAVTTFGAGTFNIGTPPTSTSCNSSTKYSICNSAPTMTFAGPSTFTLVGGIYTKSSSSLTMGSSGSANSFNIGKATDNNSLYVGNGASMIMGDATGSGDIFQMAGNMNTGGGSCLKVGAATQHDINGYYLPAGGNILGSGVYTVSQYVALGGGNGGNVTCWGTSTGLSAIGVTFVVGGSTLDTSDCASPYCSFYVGAGYSNVTLTAPTSGATQGLAVIGPTTSSNLSGATFNEGSSGTSISGAFYFPYGPINQAGSSSIGDGSGQCLELLGSQVTLAGGSSLASSCNIPGVGATGFSGIVSLVQ
ncbi:MAG TPA: pilus assembly protein TadG-related protein [Rhizomicrobium sp.]|nr:pilus assembly protein TadG-related protein [Rhizomicrobium sp.]